MSLLKVWQVSDTDIKSRTSSNSENTSNQISLGTLSKPNNKDVDDDNEEADDDDDI